EFWDTHNSADYLDEFEDVEIKVDIQKRHYLIELDSRTAELLQELARKKGVSVNYLANELLHGQLAEAE
ncbi:MAG: CopG family antitoxin, partial [Candidatus Methanoperedens sp.]|nr:CopG family antitoxin [Candidatus Methanoperedens sp.]